MQHLPSTQQRGNTPAVGYVVAAHKLHLFRSHTVMDVLNAHLTSTNVLTRNALGNRPGWVMSMPLTAYTLQVTYQLPHASQGEFAKISNLHTARDKWHGDVALDTIHACPRRNLWGVGR